MELGVFDVEHLQKNAYERSKEWATFLEDVNKRETFDEWEIAEIEDLIGKQFDERDSNEEYGSMEENGGDESQQLDTELFKNVSNATRLNLFLNNSTFALTETTTQEDADLVDLVNQTIPILQEHNRQLKETGFDSVLSTFDKNKIEEKVGSWLSRHNSLFGGDSSLATVKQEDSNNDYSNRRNEYKKSTRSSKKSGSKRMEESNDSDDSLQSGETARYIRSSRTGYVKRSTSKTLIKTHRLLSARDSLKEKYACENEYHHLNSISYQKVSNEYEYQPDCHNLRKKSQNKQVRHIAPSAVKQRSKVLRKRNVPQCCKQDDFSDSDYYDDYIEHIPCRNLATCCHTNHCSAMYNTCATVMVPTSAVKRSQCSAKKIPLARLNRKYYYFQKLSKSLSSSSSNSFDGEYDKSSLEKIKRKCNTVDTKPYKRKIKCKCCDDKETCQKYKQVVDTSTGCWYFDDNDNEVTQIINNNHKGVGNMKKSSKHVKNSKNNINDATFFSAAQIQVICNSTAMSSNSPANKRQIANKIRQQQQKKDTKENSLNEKTKQKGTKKNAKEKSYSMSFNKTTKSSNSIVTSSLRPSLVSSPPKQSLVKDCLTIVISDDENSDSALVTSTTNHNLLDNSKGILIYTPNNPSSDLTYQSSNSEGYFTITKEHLKSALGEKLAHKFLKYYIGRRRFNINSTIYYIPPKTKSLSNISTSSDSDDCLDNLGQYGDLYECI